MQGKQMNGLPVISIADGERLGAVERTYVDPAAKRVVGVGFASGGGLFAPELSPRLDARRIHTLGPDAILVDDKTAIRGETIDRRFSDLTTLDDLVGRAVMTEGGTALGKVEAVEFDERSFKLTEFDVSRGAMAGAQPISAEQATAIGLDYIIVADGVWSSATADNGQAGEQASARLEAPRKPAPA